MLMLFVVFAVLIVASAVAIISLRNPLYCALSLVLNLLCVAGLFAMLGAHFLAAVQVIVYAGAIMVLVVFVIMLLAVKDEEVYPSRFVLFGVGGIFGVLFVSVLAVLFYSEMDAPVVIDPATVGTVQNIGELLYSRYVFPFEAASILIMAAIVGATMLAKIKYRERSE